MAGNADAKTGLAKARLAYIYGVGSPDPGIPCKSKSWLLEVSTVDVKTLDKHIRIWNEELETIARSASENPFGIVLREDVMAKHAEDVDFLRRQTDQLKDEVDNVDLIQEKLDNLLDRIADNLSMDTEEIDLVTKLLDRYFKHSLNRQSLLSNFLAVQKRWQDSSAVSSTISAYETQLKETAKRKAKIAADEETRAREGGQRTPDAGHAARGNTTVFKPA